MKNDSYPCEPEKACKRCPRLVKYRKTCIKQQPDWFNGAVPSFGDRSAALLIVGLAPGLKGAHRTGRTFTGDPSGEFLYNALAKSGFSSGTYTSGGDDDFRLINAIVTNAVRCVPPQNKPVAAEINACRPFLVATIEQLPALRTILMLGTIAHSSTLRALELKQKDYPFGHGATYNIRHQNRKLSLISSYHCSRYNVNTRRLTLDMFDKILSRTRATLAVPG